MAAAPLIRSSPPTRTPAAVPRGDGSPLQTEPRDEGPRLPAPEPPLLTEIGDGVHAVDASFEDAPNQVFLVRGTDRTVLVDSGVAETPQRQLLPALGQLGLDPSDIDVVITTHGHHDHRGGNAALKAANPKLQIAAHPADRRWIEDTDIYLDELYRSVEPNWSPPPGFDDRVRRLGGGDIAVDLPLADGDTIDLGTGDVLLVRHVPAHSPGHVVVLHPRSATLFTGDALQADGTHLQMRQSFFPYYDSVDEYRRSLQLFEDLAPATFATSHHGNRVGDDVRQILSTAREMLAQTEHIVLAAASDLGAFGLGEIVDVLARRWPDYDRGMQIHRTALAHLHALEAAGTVARVSQKGWNLRSPPAGF